MKKLLQISIILMVVSISTQSFAQLRYGPKVGVNFATQKLVFDGKTDNDVKTLVSFAIGGIADYAFSESLSFQPGLLFTEKGFVYKDDDYKFSTKIYYFEIPLNVVYKYDIGILEIYGVAGPYFGFAVSGKFKYDDSTEKIKFGDDTGDDNIKRGDFGLNFGAGVEISSFQIGLNYGLGILNASYVDKGVMKNRVFSITACYFFGDGY